jgi:hypothetical protein
VQWQAPTGEPASCRSPGSHQGTRAQLDLDSAGVDGSPEALFDNSGGTALRTRTIDAGVPHNQNSRRDEVFASDRTESDRTESVGLHGCHTPASVKLCPSPIAKPSFESPDRASRVAAEASPHSGISAMPNPGFQSPYRSPLMSQSLSESQSEIGAYSALNARLRLARGRVTADCRAARRTTKHRIPASCV